MNIFWVSGRCGRLAYFLTAFICNVVIRVFGVMIEKEASMSSLIIGLIITLVCLWITICVGAKRCHDLGHNGWWQLIPFYGLVMLFSSGDIDDNEYGPAE